MIRDDGDALRLDGRHLKALYTLLRNHEEKLSDELAEMQTSVQRVLYRTLSIDEIERLNNAPPAS